MMMTSKFEQSERLVFLMIVTLAVTLCWKVKPKQVISSYSSEDTKRRENAIETYNNKQHSYSLPVAGKKMLKADSIDKNYFSFILHMPNVKIEKDDTYLCSSLKLSERTAFYITEIIPHATMKVAHHMILYACSEPGSSNESWNCGGGMTEVRTTKTPLQDLSPCSSEEVIVWAWAKDAPTFKLPKGVGFEVGGSTGHKYLVLNVHFKQKATANEGNNVHNTWVTVKGTLKPQPKLAEIYLSGVVTQFISPGSIKYFDIVCKYNGRVTLHPFAFRVHTHRLGIKVVSYRVRHNHWTLIGRKDPQAKEMFYPIDDKSLTIKQGDWLATRCVMLNLRNKTTWIGPRHNDEMCNFYMMYWIPKNESNHVKQKNCWNGLPFVHWRNYFKTLPLLNI